MEEDDDYETTIKLLADYLTPMIRRDAYQQDVERIHELSTANEKLIFLLTLIFQPQHWSSYKRILGIKSEQTVDDSLRRLEMKDFMFKDSNQFWWIKRTDNRKKKTVIHH